jgi:hypothetical protein
VVKPREVDRTRPGRTFQDIMRFRSFLKSNWTHFKGFKQGNVKFIFALYQNLICCQEWIAR